MREIRISSGCRLFFNYRLVENRPWWIDPTFEIDTEMNENEGLLQLPLFSFLPNFLVLVPYTIREARLHIRHLRELIRSLDISDAINGTEGNSLSYLPTMMQITDPKRLRQEAEKKKSAAYHPPEYLLPGSKELRPMTEYLNMQKDPIMALNSLSLSAFNPPPGPRKMKVSDNCMKKYFLRKNI